MKKCIVLIAALLVLFQVFAVAAAPEDEALKRQEDELKQKMKELGYMGQLDKANEMLGEKTNFSSEKDTGGYDTTSLVLSMLWGAIGAGYFIYGKKQSRLVFLLCGIVLCVFPIFVSGSTVSLILGLAMTIAPFKIDF